MFLYSSFLQFCEYWCVCVCGFYKERNKLQMNKSNIAMHALIPLYALLYITKQKQTIISI